MENGDGGEVIVWADHTTRFYGDISAKGGSESGDGGFIEVSGKTYLDFQGNVDTTAAKGETGTLLLDPDNIEIVAGDGDLLGFDPEGDDVPVDTLLAFAEDDGDGTSQLGVNFINSATSDVVLQANNDITFNANIFMLNGGIGLEALANGNITVNANITTNNGDVTLTADADNNGSGDLTIFNRAISTGMGDITLSGSQTTGGLFDSIDAGVLLFSARLTTTGGDITITGKGQENTNGYGVNLRAADIATVDGDITILGDSSSITGGGSKNHGVLITDNSIVSTTGNGEINITGLGGNGTSDNYGVYMTHGGTEITTLNGAIMITGTGGDGTGDNNFGINIENANISSESSKYPINLIGYGGNGNSNNYGVNLFGATIDNIDGAINIEGIGGGTNEKNHGINLDTALIYTAGKGDVTITGTASDGNRENQGVVMNQFNTIFAGFDYAALSPDFVAEADLKIIGYAGDGIDSNIGVNASWYNFLGAGGELNINGYGAGDGTGDNNHGVLGYQAGFSIYSAGNVNINGIAGDGINNNLGINLDRGIVIDTSGNITLDGTGNGTGTNNYGVGGTSYLRLISDGNITINGTGGNGTNHNYGVYVSKDPGTLDSSISAAGNIDIDGFGNGTGTDNYGVYISNNTDLATIGEGNIDIYGTGGNGTSNNYGVYITDTGTSIRSYYVGPVDPNKGAITITGEGNGTSDFNIGVLVSGDAMIRSPWGSVTIDGTGGNGSAHNFGVYISDTGTSISTVDGFIDIYGTGNGAANNNVGVVLTNDMEISTTYTGSSDPIKGSITIDGTSSNGTNDNYGTWIADSSIHTVDGRIDINGQGNGTTSESYGVFLAPGSDLSTDSGTITLFGTGGNGTDENFGVYISGTGASISSTDGPIDIFGQGNGTGNDNYGVLLDADVRTINGALTINGTGADGTNRNYGVFLDDNFSDIDSQNGSTTVTGTGHGTGIENHGIFINDASVGGNGLTMFGTASSSGTAANGILINNSSGIESSGKMTLTGIANGPDNTGINIQNSFLKVFGGSNMTLRTNKIEIGAGSSLRGTGGLMIKPLDPGTSIGLGDGTTGTLNLDGSELATFEDGFSLITIGSSDGTGDVNIGDAAFTDNVLIHGGDFYLWGDISSTATGDAIVMDGTGQGKQGNFYKMGSDILTPNGRWLVYAYDPDTSVEGSLSSFEHEYGKVYDEVPLFGGSGFVYVLGGEVTPPEPPLPPPCAVSSTCIITPPPPCEVTGMCEPEPPLPPKPTCEELGTCPIIEPLSCEESGTCPLEPPPLSCEELGTCPTEPEVEPSVELPSPQPETVNSTGSGYIAANTTHCIPDEEKGIKCDWQMASLNHDVTFFDRTLDIATSMATDIANTIAMTTILASSVLKNELDYVTQQLDESAKIKNETQALLSYSLAGTTIALSLGFFGWAFKTGALFASLLSVLPIWARFDPLPILNLSTEQREELKIALNKIKKEEKLVYKEMATMLDKEELDNLEREV